MSRNQPGKPNSGFGQRVQPDEQHFTRKLKSKAAQDVYSAIAQFETSI